MSCCLVFQAKNYIIVGADTALSVPFGKNLYLRSDNDGKKIFTIGKDIVFCSGHMGLATNVVENMKVKDGYVDLEHLSAYLRSKNIEKMPDPDCFSVGVIICRVVDDVSYVYTLELFNNFEVVTHIGSDQGTQIWVGGFNTKKCLEIAKNELKSQDYEITNTYVNTYKKMACQEIGGRINVYYLNSKEYQKIIDEYDLEDGFATFSPYFNAMKHAIWSDLLMGDLIAGNQLKIYGGQGEDKKEEPKVIIDENGITLDGCAIKWTKKLPSSSVDGLDDTLDSLTAYKTEIEAFKTKINNSLFTTDIGEDYVISPKIGGGYLYIDNGDYSVEIDPEHAAGNDKTKDGYLFCIRNTGEIGKEEVIMGVNTDGNGYFSGKINAQSGQIGAYDIDSFNIACSNYYGRIALQKYLTTTGAPALFSTGMQDTTDGALRLDYVDVSAGKINCGQMQNSSYVTHMEISDNNDYPGILFYTFSDTSGTSTKIGAIRREKNHISIKTFNGNRTTIDGKTLNNMVISDTVNLKSMTLAGNYDGYNTNNEVPSINGYTAIAAFPHSSNAADVCWMSCYLENGVVNAGLKNTVGTQKTFTPSVTVLYVKNF